MSKNSFFSLAFWVCFFFFANSGLCFFLRQFGFVSFLRQFGFVEQLKASQQFTFQLARAIPMHWVFFIQFDNSFSIFDYNWRLAIILLLIVSLSVTIHAISSNNSTISCPFCGEPHLFLHVHAISVYIYLLNYISRNAVYKNWNKLQSWMLKDQNVKALWDFMWLKIIDWYVILLVCFPFSSSFIDFFMILNDKNTFSAQ